MELYESGAGYSIKGYDFDDGSGDIIRCALEAITDFEQYLHLAPAAPDRGEVEARIDRLKTTLSQPQSSKETTP